jgi:Skp family chaperone for outer membrane proteins
MVKLVFVTIAFMGLCLTSCSETKKEKVVVNTTPNIQAQKIGELKIAYYDQDSMKLNFEYYKEQDAIVTKKQLAFQATLEKKRAAGQAYYETYAKRAQNNELSQVEDEGYQRNLQAQEAEMMKYQEEEGAKLEKETLAKLESIGNKIEKFSKKYCEENGIDILLIYAKGGQINYITPKMNVTKEFTAYLNQNQEKIKKEVGKN